MFIREFKINCKFVLIMMIVLLSGLFIVGGHSVQARSIPSDLYPYGLIAYTQNKKLIPINRYKYCHYQTGMSRDYIKAVTAHEYQAVNFYRSRAHRPLRRNPALAKLAAQRAYQASKHFTHYYHGKIIAWQDAQRMHLGNLNWLSHNLGENMCLVGKLNHVRENYRDAYYYFNQPSTLANCNVFDLVNNDAASNYAHGMNIMNGHNRYIGVGTYYNHSKRVLYILSEFSIHKPVIKSNHR